MSRTCLASYGVMDQLNENPRAKRSSVQLNSIQNIDREMIGDASCRVLLQVGDKKRCFWFEKGDEGLEPFG